MVAITKDTLRELNSVVGSLDDSTGKIFSGFIGRRHAEDGLYHGELTFSEQGDDEPEEYTDIQAIITGEETDGNT